MTEKFFKIDPAKLAERIPQNDNRLPAIKFNVSQLAMISGLEDNRFWVHIAARRTGKSFSASILALAKLLEPGQSVIVVAPNFTLSSIIWEFVTDFIRKLELETIRFNQKDKVVQLINGSTFRLLSANNRDSLVGRGANLLIVDEAAIIEDDEYFTRDLAPALSTYADSRALFISTPRGQENYLYDYYLRGADSEFRDWGSARFTYEANPLLSLDAVEASRKAMPASLFAQEYLCDWTTFEGQIYPLDEDIHVKDLSDIYPRDGRFDFIAGLDVGYRDDTAFIVIATDGEAFYIVDEYVAREKTTSQNAEGFQELIDKWNIENIYVDSAAQQLRADLAYDYDIYCDNAIKSVNDGISAIQTLIEMDPPLLYIDKHAAENTFSSLVKYKWNPKTEKPKPIHDWSSHCCDALRYAIYSYQKNTIGIYSAH